MNKKIQILIILVLIIFLGLIVITQKNPRIDDKTPEEQEIREKILSFENNKNYFVRENYESGTVQSVTEYYRYDDKIKIDYVKKTDSTIQEFMEYDPELVERMNKELEEKINTFEFYDLTYKYEICQTTKTGKCSTNFENAHYTHYNQRVVKDALNEFTVFEPVGREVIDDRMCLKIKVTNDATEYYIWLEENTAAILKMEEKNDTINETVEYKVVFDIVKEQEVQLFDLSEYNITDVIEE